MSLLSRFRRTAVTLGIALAAAIALLPAQAFAQAAGDYRSAASGNWNAIATWQRFDGTNWVAAVATPSSTDGAIEIRSPDVVTISASGLSIDQVTVDAGAQVTVASTVTSTLANGTGTDLVINGTWLNQGGTWTTTGTWSVGAGGTFIHNTTSGIATPLGQSSLDAASTFIYRGSGTLTPAISTSGRTYGNLSFESTSGTWSAAPNGAGTLTINGNLTIGPGVTVNTTQTGTMTIAGNLTNNGTLTNGTGTQVYTFTGSGKSIGGSGTAIAFETLNINTGASITFASAVTLGSTFTTTVSGTAIAAAAITNSGTLSVVGTLQLDPGGSITTNAPTYGGASTLIYNKAATVATEWGSGSSAGAGVPQNVTVQTGTLTLPGTARTVPGSLTFNGGSASLAGGDLAVNGTLALGSSKITTGSSKVALPASGSLTRSTGYVQGNLQKNVATGSSVARTFEIGDPANYTPVSLSFASVSGAGDLTASTATPGSIPGPANLSASKFVNRSWTVTNSGATFTTYDATLNFASGDVQGSGDPNKFVVAKNTSGTWTNPAVGARTSTSTQATGMNALSDFYVGEPAAYTITATAGANGSISPSGAVSVANGGSQTFTITPNGGYLVQDVLVDGGSVGAVTSFPFTNVGANHTISASFIADPNATVNAVSPGTFVTTVANATVPITLTRGVTTPVLGYSVTLQLSGLTTTSGAFTEGGFLSASGSSTTFQVVDNGGGSYTVDGVTLGSPCGSSATSGTLFSLAVGSTLLSGSGTVTITSLTLRDCSNVTLPSNIGTAASVAIDRSTPSVAVTSPNGGESWLAGSSHAITWTATDAEGIAANSITLEYSIDNGTNWLPVASGLANSGTFSWTVPNNPSTTALVRASALDIHANPASDASDAVFTIQGTSTTSVTSSPNPSVVGESVTLTATVTPASATGTVEFFDGATSLGTAPLAGGSASINTASLAVGPHSLTAVYGGSALTAGSTSAAHSHTVNQASTSTSLASAPNPSTVGENVTLTASVSVSPPGAGSPGGSVEFFDGATSLGTSPLSGGSATLNTAALAAGGHSLTAVYSGDPSFSGSTSAAHSHTVNVASTTTALTSAPNPSTFGANVTLTATVAVSPPGAGTPTGSVEFFDGATSLGTAPLSGGSAALNTAALAVGGHSLTAVYAGDPNFSGSTSPAHSHTVNQAPTITTLTSSPNPSVHGQSVTLTATVTGPGLVPVTGGTVEFFKGATSLGTSPVSGGTASIPSGFLNVGSPTFTAVYSGNTDYTGSTSAVYTHTVNMAQTMTVVTTSPNPSNYGDPVTITATTTAVPPGAGTPQGPFQFFDGSTFLGQVMFAPGGVASITTSALTPGSHSITATGGDGNFFFHTSTSAPVTQVVNAATSSTAVTTSPNPSVVGESVTITATVTPSAATGSVEFFDGATSLGTSPLSSGSAALATASLALGSHSITAVYSGDLTYPTSTSPVHSHTVNSASTSTAVTTSPNPSVVGESVTISASVTVNPPGAGSPSGSVEFFDGATSLGTSPLSGGSASLNTSALTVGGHSITAVYSGDPSFGGSTSPAHSHTVNPASTSTSLASAPNPSTFGSSVTLTASVSVNPPGAGSPSGSVEFFDGATSLGSSPLSGGSATLNTSALAVGPHSLTAVYSGDPSFSGSTSAVHSHTVNAASSSTSLVSSLNPSTSGQAVTFTATVTPSGATGSVEFFDGASSLGTSPLVSGSASLSTSALTPGSHPITAVFSGDASYSGSTSNLVTQVVNSAGTSVSLVAAPNPVVFLDPATLTATVSPSAATGSVEFFDGVTSLGTSPVSGGSAQLITSSLAVGVHSLTAHYLGDGTYSPSTSAPTSLEVKAKIVATAGANGSIAPLGTTLYSLNATPSYTFAANPGYHVSSVTVDGGAVALTSPYTFVAVSANHTIDVQFTVNPAVPAITTLTATQVRTGNDADGNTKITLSWTAVPAGSTVEVWRKGYGNYPEYDDGATPGSVPATPGSYPPAGWTLTTVTSPGSTDEPGTRDFWYYVAYVTDSFGTRSSVSNQSAGTLSYHLGDVSDGSTPGNGDNKVTTSDLSVLGAHYGISGAAVATFGYLDVGPTTDLAVTSRPMTDDRIDFEDLVLFAINYFPVATAPQAHATPAAANQDALALTAPNTVHAGEDIAVRVSFTGTGRVLAISTRLAWDPAVVQPVNFTAGDAVLEQGALLFSAAPGSVDGAVFTGNGHGFTGEGEFATLHFRVVAAGDPKFGFAATDARDAQNHTVTLATGVTAVTPKSFVTAFAPAMPNPFGRSTTFAFSLAKAGRADLEVFSVEGRRVRTITSGPREAGEYRLEWNGADDSGRPISPGVYYARLVTSQGTFKRVVTRLE
jgi:hypothetical protein